MDSIQSRLQAGRSTDNVGKTPIAVTIVILTWNGLDYTKKCLHTLRDLTGYPDYRVLLVENGSSDGTVPYVRSLPWIDLIANDRNIGFAAGNNLAIQLADVYSDVILLNNDTEIRDPLWIWKLQRTAYSAPDIGIVGCRLTRPDGMFQHAGAYLPLDTFWGQQCGSGERDINQYSADRDVESIVFACAYLRRSVLDAVGPLDEDYFSYFEDTDYCLRASIQGFRTVCCGGLTVIHHENTSAAVNSVKHSDMFSRAQTVFRRKWERKLRKTRYTRQIGWHSIFNFPVGYAMSSRELVCALDRAGVHVAYKYVYGPGTVITKPEREISDSYLVNMIRQRTLTPERVQVVYGQGDVFESNFGAYKIGFTMLETDRIPKEWVRQANLMDEVWVPSTFNRQTVLESGVTRPVHVIPLGADPNYFHPEIAAHPLSGVYTFLSVFEWGERKAPEILLRAFNDEFRSDEPVILLCKTINVDTDVDVTKQVADLDLRGDGGRIHLALNHMIPSYQLGSLYRSSDCFVLATRGEGWGMPVIEAMACGLPVIATNWSAHCDFMTEDNAYPLPVDALVPAIAKCPYYAGFNWAEPSYAHLRRLLRHVYENQAEARAKGARASREIRENWTWDHAARKIIARLDAIAQQRSHKSGSALQFAHRRRDGQHPFLEKDIAY